MIPAQYDHVYVPVKHFLMSFRALLDAKSGVTKLSDLVTRDEIVLADWRILWIGTCTLLRTSIDLFQVDARSCINIAIRNELKNEFASIKENAPNHKIYWDFIKKERDNIVHEYKWSVYEKWLTNDGEIPSTGLTLLTMNPDEIRSVLEMRDGPYAGRDSLELLHEGAVWVESRIFSAIERAGFSPDEERNLVNFGRRPRPTGIGSTILANG